jgi:SAM-dependent methyltransferase
MSARRMNADSPPCGYKFRCNGEKAPKGHPVPPRTTVEGCKLPLESTMPADQPASRGRSFDAWADEYDRFRPRYPDELFDLISTALELGPRPVVADLGAGTGAASIAMARRGWTVYAVEPGSGMRETLARSATAAPVSLEIVPATAESTGLGEGSIDLVTAAQAFHWFDPQPAVAEMARILRPGGGVALFWNVRDDDASPFLAAYSELLERYLPGVEIGGKVAADESRTRDQLAANAAFTVEPRRRHLHHTMVVSPGEFVSLAFTSSYVRGGLNGDEQQRFRNDVVALIAEHHGGDQPFQVPYRVDIWLARRA